MLCACARMHVGRFNDWRNSLSGPSVSSRHHFLNFTGPFIGVQVKSTISTSCCTPFILRWGAWKPRTRDSHLISSPQREKIVTVGAHGVCMSISRYWEQLHQECQVSPCQDPSPQKTEEVILPCDAFFGRECSNMSIPRIHLLTISEL